MYKKIITLLQLVIEIFKMDEQKIAIKVFYDGGFQPNEILKRFSGLNISKDKVYRVCKHLREGRSVDNRYRSGRSRSVRTRQTIKKIREKIRRNPQRSAREIARSYGISPRSVRLILKEDLGLHPYKKRKVHGLTIAQIQKRFTRSKQLINWLDDHDLEKVVFSDEKLFGVEEKLNSQNVRIYAMSIEDIPEEQRTVKRFKNEKKVMVWCGISKKGKFPMVFIESGIRIDHPYYIHNVLESVVKVEGERMFPEGDWVFQQDSAPAHKANNTQNWCRTNLPEFISTSEWPPSSPDLNPLDYSIWAFLRLRSMLHDTTVSSHLGLLL